MNILTNVMVDKIEKNNMAQVYLNNGDVIEAEKVLIAVGVQGNIENIGLEECGIIMDNGWIKVNNFMETYFVWDKKASWLVFSRNNDEKAWLEDDTYVKCAELDESSIFQQ